MLHKDAAIADVHVVHHWSVADIAARNALTVASDDVGKVAKVGSNYDILVDDSPMTWYRLTALPPGGSTGQVATKLSSTDYDANWQTPAAAVSMSIGKTLALPYVQF